MYSRRDFGKLAIAGLPLSSLALKGASRINSRIDGVLIGAQSYSFRDLSLEDAIKAMVDIFGPFLPGLSERCVKAKVCLYTEVNGARFILDRLPGSPNIIVASPCSGHGFKHSGGIGDVLAQMALGEKRVMLGGQAIDMTPFALRADGPPWRP